MNGTTKNLARLATVGAMLVGTFGSVQAADLPVYKKAPPPVEAFNPWMVRLRVLGVLPDAGGSTVNVAGVPSLSSPNSGLSISDQVVPELDISYFFTKNIAAELILGVTRHSISGNGSLANLPIGKTTLLPPTLTLQYHFDNFGAFKPYIGAGVNYTVFFNNSAANAPAAIVGPPAIVATTTSVHVSNAWGGAVCSSALTTCSTGTGVSTSTSRSSGCGRITQQPSAACRSQAPRISIRGWSVAV